VPESAERFRLKYVSDLVLKEGGGGSYAVNWNAFQQLSQRFDATYCGPIVPKLSTLETLISRVQRRILQRPGNFTYFSESTLRRNAAAVMGCFPDDVDAVVFRSAARWCRVRLQRPYFVYLDASFHTFFHNTFREDDFHRHDLERIYEAEAGFLEQATGVFFESLWGLQKARDAYSLSGSHFAAVGRGGVIAPPPRDTWDGESYRLVTMAMNFQQKGGDVVSDAYRVLKNQFPALTWHIIGGVPPAAVIAMPGVTYEGILDPGNARQRTRIEENLASGFLLLHPTREDTSPLVITEAAYFGCPAVATNAFAIPELVVHGVTGMLINTPSATNVVDAVAELVVNRQKYRDMRVNARNHALARDRWDKVGQTMSNHIEDALSAR
jgi:glycosyltransferase involved in cell wall biosynthesis